MFTISKVKIFVVSLVIFIARSVHAQDHPKIAGVAIINDPYKIEGAIISSYISHILDSYDDSKNFKFPSDVDYLDQKKWFRKFRASLAEVLNENDAVDNFVLGHHFFQVQELISKIPQSLTSKIRLIYMSGCSDGNDKNLDYFISRGVQIVIGHPHYKSSSDVFARSFIANWLEGKTAKNSIEIGNKNVKSSWITKYYNNNIDSSNAVWKGNAALLFSSIPTYQKSMR